MCFDQYNKFTYKFDDLISQDLLLIDVMIAKKVKQENQSKKNWKIHKNLSYLVNVIHIYIYTHMASKKIKDTQ